MAENKSSNKPNSPSKPSERPKTEISERRNYTLPTTSANPPMPTVKPPKSEK